MYLRFVQFASEPSCLFPPLSENDNDLLPVNSEGDLLDIFRFSVENQLNAIISRLFQVSYNQVNYVKNIYSLLSDVKTELEGNEKAGMSNYTRSKRNAGNWISPTKIRRRGCW